MDTEKLLNEVFRELLREVHLNPELGSRLGEIIEEYALGKKKISRRPYRRKSGAFDPIVVYRGDPSELKRRLEELNIEELKDIIAEQGMDRSKLAMKWKREQRLIDLIIMTVETRIHKGDAFRTVPSKIYTKTSPLRSIDGTKRRSEE